jgi:hypothetical protein
MTQRQFLKTIGSGAAFAAIMLGWMSLTAQSGGAQDVESAMIEKGFAITPVPLKLDGKDRALVGLGSYLVNGVGACSDCHTNPPYREGRNPYFGQQKGINQAGYLGGGQSFGPFISRNLTPDRTGRPEGGHTFAEFLQIMRTGIDLDHLHPNLPPPLDGKLLQVMPWPIYKTMNDHELRAIYEYLSTIPCVAGPSSGPLHNDCP